MDSIISLLSYALIYVYSYFCSASLGAHSLYTLAVRKVVLHFYSLRSCLIACCCVTFPSYVLLPCYVSSFLLSLSLARRLAFRGSPAWQPHFIPAGGQVVCD